MASFSYFTQQLLCIVYILVEGDLPIPGCNRNVIFPLTWADVLSAVLAITLLLPVVADVVSRLELKAKRGHISAPAIQCHQHQCYVRTSLSTCTLIVGISASGQEVALEHKFISFLLYIGEECFQNLCCCSLPWPLLSLDSFTLNPNYKWCVTIFRQGVPELNLAHI